MIVYLSQKMATPWKSIWTSLPFWAILLAHSGQSLGFWTLLTEIPSYMNKVLGVNIKSVSTHVIEKMHEKLCDSR